MTPRNAFHVVAAVVAAIVVEASGQELRSNIAKDIRPSEVQAELEKVDEKLREGKWKAGLRHAQNVAETVIKRTWYGRELPRIVAEMAFLQAVAEANLDKRELAVWHWYIAQNLDFRMRARDLSPYGKAGKLLREYPLRDLGEVPAGFQVPQPLAGSGRYRAAVKPVLKTKPIILNNTGAVIEGTGNFRVEVMLDEKGKIRQPVVTSEHLHPIVIYASLEFLRTMPPFKPAFFDGKPVDAIEKVVLQFEVSRW